MIPLGDPAYLCPRLYGSREHLCGKYASTLEKRDLINVVIPHWRNREAYAWDRYAKVNVAVHTYGTTNAPDPVEAKLAEILRPGFVLTSSLHVAIVRLVYGVPFALAAVGSEVIDKPVKFRDTFDHLGIPLVWHTTVEAGRNWWEKYVEPRIDHHGRIIPDEVLDALDQCFPRDLYR